jgi:hypothetical protein
VHIASPSDLTVYQFGRKFVDHSFCGICAVPVFIRMVGPSPEIAAKLSEEEKTHLEQATQLNPVNLHVVDGVEWDKVKVSKVQGKESEPKYVVY